MFTTVKVRAVNQASSRQPIANIIPTNHVSQPVFLLFYSLSVAVIKVTLTLKLTLRLKLTLTLIYRKLGKRTLKTYENNSTHRIRTRDSMSTIQTPYH